MISLIERALRGLTWRLKIGLEKVSERLGSVRAKVAMRISTLFLKPRHHGLKSPLVVSLTSYPPRFAQLHLTVLSLLQQSVKPDHLILWIAQKDMAKLPSQILRLKDRGLEIRPTVDTRSYKKIWPSLDAYPDAYIATADDDAYYRTSWLEGLVECMKVGRNPIVCYRAHLVSVGEDGKPADYKTWTRGSLKNNGSDLLFPTGVGGVLYAPQILHHSESDRQAAIDLCPDGDDIWLYWMARRNGATYAIAPGPEKIVLWSGSQHVALWRTNYGDGRNDVQIAAMVERYPLSFGA